MTTNGNAGDLAIVGGYRTPFTKAGTELKDAQAADLATHVFREVLDRTGIDPAGWFCCGRGEAGPSASGGRSCVDVPGGFDRRGSVYRGSWYRRGSSKACRHAFEWRR